MIIVTGAAGFIGSNLVRGLNQRGETELLLVDDLSDGDKHRGLGSLDFVDYVDKDEFLDRLPEFVNSEVRALFHQGACSDTMERDGRFMLETNYEYSKALLEAAQESEIPFFYASSASVYGDGEAGFREDPSCERPLNVYAFSKWLFDRHVRRVLPQATAQIVGLRYFNVYGPQENHKGRMASVAFHFFEQIRRGERMRLFEGSESFRRDFVYVGDAVDVNLFFLDHPDASGIFNCGTGRAESFVAVAEAMRSAFDGAAIETIPFPEELVGKYQAFTQADLTALRAAGYRAEFRTVAEGVAEYVEVLRAGGGYWR